MVRLSDHEEWAEKAVINRFDITALQQSFMESAMACPAPEGPWRTPKFVRYVRNRDNWQGITYFTDKLLHMAPQINSKHKIAFLQEPPDLMPEIYRTIKQFEEYYDIIFTYEQTLLDHNPEKYIFLPPDMAALEPSACGMHKKTKLASLIYSFKQDLPGHKLRHKIVNEHILDTSLEEKIELFGSGSRRPIKNKSEGCVDFMFQIAIENAKRINFFTDKILDCFISGCVPIYWGCPNIGDFFDTRGILTFETEEELLDILSNITEDKYLDMLGHAKNNYELAREYQWPDDYCFIKILEKLKSVKII